MKKALGLLAATIVLLAASACAGDDSAADAASPTPSKSSSATPTPTPTKPTSAPATPKATVESVYLSELRKAHASLTTATDESLIGVGEAICTMYDSGATTSQVNDYLVTASGVTFTAMEYAAMHGVGVAAFCPDHLQQLQDS